MVKCDDDFVTHVWLHVQKAHLVLRHNLENRVHSDSIIVAPVSAIFNEPRARDRETERKRERARAQEQEQDSKKARKQESVRARKRESERV